MSKSKRWFIGCECSGVVRRAFRALGHEAWSCDRKPADDGSPHHIQGDALATLRAGCPVFGLDGQEVYRMPWDGAIIHPPCTRLALSGALRLYRDGKKANGKDPAKWAEMVAGAQFFRSFFAGIDGPLCAENPLMHGHALGLILPHVGEIVRQTVQPHEFGDDASKATVLWLRGLPPLMPSHVAGDMFADEPPAPRMVGGLPRYANQTDSGQNRLPPSEGRAAARAVTYDGIAAAMASQWGEYLSR